MHRTKFKDNGARQRGRARMQQFAQSLSRTARRFDDDDYRRIIPLPPAASGSTDVELFVTSTENFPEPESKPRLSMRERVTMVAEKAVARSVAGLSQVNDWSVGVHPLALSSEDTRLLQMRGIDPGDLCVYGRVNGDVFRSSPIVKIFTVCGETVIRTFSGRRYRLGSPNPDFQTWCREHDFAMPTAEHRWHR